MKIKPKQIIAFLAAHGLLFLFGSAVFVVLFRTSLFSGLGILFYRGILLLLVAGFFLFLIALFIRRKIPAVFTARDICLSLVLFLSFHLVFFTHFPVTAERSISVFLLGYLNHYPDQSFSDEELSTVFMEKYVYDHQAIAKRFSEQSLSGNILCRESGCSISERGKKLIAFYSFLADLFRIDKKLILPK